MRYAIKPCGGQFKILDLETGDVVGTFSNFSLANAKLESLGDSVPTQYFANKEFSNDGEVAAVAPSGGGGSARFTEAHFSQPVNKFSAGARRKKRRKIMRANETFYFIANEEGYAPNEAGLTRVQLAPYGRFAHSGGMQVFTKEDAKAIVNEWTGLNKILNPHKYMGIPWYVGHPDHPAFKDRYRDTAAYGRIKTMEVGEDGLYANVKFNEEGKRLINQEKFHGHSVNWKVRQEGNDWRPFSLKSVGFTNEPNIPVKPVLHANEAQEAANDGTSEGAAKGWETRRGGMSAKDQSDAAFTDTEAAVRSFNKTDHGTAAYSHEQARNDHNAAAKSGIGDSDYHTIKAAEHRDMALLHRGVESGKVNASTYLERVRQVGQDMYRYRTQQMGKAARGQTEAELQRIEAHHELESDEFLTARQKAIAMRDSQQAPKSRPITQADADASVSIPAAKKHGMARVSHSGPIGFKMTGIGAGEKPFVEKSENWPAANELTEKLTALVQSDARFEMVELPNEQIIMPAVTPAVADIVYPNSGDGKLTVICQCSDGLYYANQFTIEDGEPVLCDGAPKRVKRATPIMANAFPPNPKREVADDEPDDAEVQAAADGGDVATAAPDDEDDADADTDDLGDGDGDEDGEQAPDGDGDEPGAGEPGAEGDLQFGVCPDCGETDPDGTEEDQGLVKCGKCGAIEPAEDWQQEAEDTGAGEVGDGSQMEGGAEDHGKLAHTASAAALAGKDNALHDSAADTHFAAAQKHRGEGNNAHAQLHELLGKWHQNYAEKDRLKRQSPMSPGEKPGQPNAGAMMQPQQGQPQGQQRQPGQQQPQRPQGQPQQPQRGQQPPGKPGFQQPGQKPPQKPGQAKGGMPSQFQKKQSANEQTITEGDQVKLNDLSNILSLPENSGEPEILARLQTLANGDYPGHPFHGNQWGAAGGNSSPESGAASKKAYMSSKGAKDKGSHAAAAKAHMRAAKLHDKDDNDHVGDYHRAMAKFHSKRAGIKFANEDDGGDEGGEALPNAGSPASVPSGTGKEDLGVPKVKATGASAPAAEGVAGPVAPKTAGQPKPPGPQAMEDWQAKYKAASTELANCTQSLSGLTTGLKANETELTTCAQKRHALEGEITGLRAQLASATAKLEGIANERKSLTPQVIERAVKQGIILLSERAKLEQDLANGFDGAVAALLLRDPALKTTSMCNDVGTRNGTMQSAAAGDRMAQITSAVKAEEMAMANEGVPADYTAAWERAKKKNPVLWEAATEKAE